jgi:hypothetical protein
MSRRFVLVRNEDATGISGTGTVAEGIEWTRGWCSLMWLTDKFSCSIYPSIRDIEVIHGHNGKTQIQWLDPPTSAGLTGTSAKPAGPNTEFTNTSPDLPANDRYLAAYGQYDSDLRTNGPDDFDAFRDAVQGLGLGLPGTEMRSALIAQAMEGHFSDCATSSGPYAHEEECTCGEYDRRMVINKIDEQLGLRPVVDKKGRVIAWEGHYDPASGRCPSCLEPLPQIGDACQVCGMSFSEQYLAKAPKQNG